MSDELPRRHCGTNFRRFSCTQCGACCNRPPEVALSETLDLAQDFVFRLMFRIYALPNKVEDYNSEALERRINSAVYFQRRRLLSAFCARSWPAEHTEGGRRVRYTKYLMVTALALQTRSGSCSGLNENRCGLYERRPLSCRSVPFHYSHAEALAYQNFDRFVANPKYHCGTDRTADVVLQDGRIIAPEFVAAREMAAETARIDRRWAKAIVGRLPADGEEASLPSLLTIEENAPLGVTTTSMRVAWQISAEVGLLKGHLYQDLAIAQLALINQEIAHGQCNSADAETLLEMQREYSQAIMQQGMLNRS